MHEILRFEASAARARPIHRRAPVAGRADQPDPPPDVRQLPARRYLPPRQHAPACGAGRRLAPCQRLRQHPPLARRVVFRHAGKLPGEGAGDQQAARLPPGAIREWTSRRVGEWGSGGVGAVPGRASFRPRGPRSPPEPFGIGVGRPDRRKAGARAAPGTVRGPVPVVRRERHPVQRELNIEEEGSYILTVKNREKPAPPGAGLPRISTSASTRRRR